MSRKKISTKSSKKRTPKHVVAFEKKWGHKPDRADKRFYERMGRWPSQNEFAFWDANKRFPKKGELANLTRQKKKEKKIARSVASKRAWEKRKLKSPEIAKWERDRRALQAAQKEDLERAEKRGIRRPMRFHRWYDFFYISLTNMDLDDIYGLLLAMKRRGVQTFRIEREVPVGEYKDPNDFKSASGFISTKFQFMGRLSETDLRYGNSRTGLPALTAMRAPGIDFMRYIVVSDTDIRDHFPNELRKQMLRRKKETRDTIRDRRDEVWYLTKGKKITEQQRKMRDRREAIDNDLAEEDENDEG